MCLTREGELLLLSVAVASSMDRKGGSAGDGSAPWSTKLKARMVVCQGDTKSVLRKRCIQKYCNVARLDVLRDGEALCPCALPL